MCERAFSPRWHALLHLHHAQFPPTSLVLYFVEFYWDSRPKSRTFLITETCLSCFSPCSYLCFIVFTVPDCYQSALFFSFFQSVEFGREQASNRFRSPWTQVVWQKDKPWRCALSSRTLRPSDGVPIGLFSFKWRWRPLTLANLRSQKEFPQKEDPERHRLELLFLLVAFIPALANNSLYQCFSRQ